MNSHTLHFGPYKTPRVRIGQIVECEVRGKVCIVKLSDSPIPWPSAKKPGRPGRSAPVVFRDLAKAIRKESAVAVCFWWGVTGQTISKWRGRLGIGSVTPGFSMLQAHRNRTDGRIIEGRAKAHAKSSDPERKSKIAATMRGKPRPKHVIAAMRKGRLGKPQSEESRAKMREAHRRRRERAE